MANKRQPTIIEKSNFNVFIAGRLGALGGKMADIAELLGVSQATAYQLISGALEPSAEVLKRAGLREVYVLEIEIPEPQEQDQPPAKPAKGKK